jgi:choline dehydrogenase
VLRRREHDSPALPTVLGFVTVSDESWPRRMFVATRLAREIAATAPLAGLLEEEVWPGRACVSGDAVRAYVRCNAGTVFHPTGTCKMGVDPDTVVDPELRVHGLRGLRVADASIMPRIIGGNTNAPVIMIAEKAADLALGRRWADPGLHAGASRELSGQGGARP